MTCSVSNSSTINHLIVALIHLLPFKHTVGKLYWFTKALELQIPPWHPACVCGGLYFRWDVNLQLTVWDVKWFNRNGRLMKLLMKSLPLLPAPLKTKVYQLYRAKFWVFSWRCSVLKFHYFNSQQVQTGVKHILLPFVFSCSSSLHKCHA